MNSKSTVLTAKKYLGHLIVFVLLLALAAGVLLFGWMCTPHSGFELADGQVDLTGYRRPDERVIYLDGEWEYYAGQLIASEATGELPEPVLTKLPIRGFSDVTRTPENGKASFRILLTNVPEEAVLALTIPAYYGEYSVYLDGQRQVEPITKNSSMYFPFAFIPDYSGATHELIIEVDQPYFFGFDKCPVLSDNDVPFNNYMGVRTVFFVFMGMLLFAYVILPIVYRFYTNSDLRCFAISGCVSFFLFVLETLWYCGVLGYLQTVIRADLLYILRNVLKFVLVFTVFRATIFQCKPPISLRLKRWCTLTAAILAGVALIALICLSRPMAMSVFYVCVGIVAILAMGVQCKGVLRSGRPALTPAIGSLAMLTGFFFVDLSIGAETTLAYQMVLPACMLVTLVCWSLMISDRQKLQIAVLEKALTAEQAAARTQAAFLASQIQPHFLYNTLTTIQELCYTDPPQAADTVVRFSNYLRQNIDFMEYKDKIPFAVEMEHIENYLDIQRTRFGDAIKFIKDIEFEQFELPPLTVQPLVENAVSHGIRKHSGQGTVRLSVRKIGQEIVISVADDGEGFDIGAVHSRSLENIRCRIEGAMNGMVLIDSRPGKGTTVTLRFPYKEAMIHANYSS